MVAPSSQDVASAFARRGGELVRSDEVCRVVLVDDDVWVRAGQAAMLAGVPGIEVCAELNFTEALDRRTGWDDVDVVVVDAYDRQGNFDRFRGASVVESIRRTSLEVLVVVVSGRISDPHLRLRMAEVGADFFYERHEVDDLDVLTSVILCPDEQRRATPGDPGELWARGLTCRSRPHRFLGWLCDHELEDAFAPGQSQAATGLSRRRIMAIRAAAARIGGLRPRPGGSTGGPQYKSGDPTWRQVVDFVNGSRGRGPR